MIVAVSAMTAFSAVRTLHLANADAMLPSLMSTERLTWFYWGQDRLANLVPLLAIGVQDVFWNLRVQMFLVGLGWFCLAALFAGNQLADRGVRRAPALVAATVVGAGLLTWAVFPEGTEQVFVFEQLYAFSLALFLTGLFGVVNARRRWQVAGTVAVLGAVFVNPSLAAYVPFVLVLPGVTILRPGPRRLVPARQVVRAFLVTCASLVVATAASSAFGEPPPTDTGYNRFSVGKMFDNVGNVFDQIGASVVMAPTVIVLVGAVVVLISRRRQLTARLMAGYLGALLFALAWAFGWSGNEWIERNGLAPRYFFPVYAAGLMLITAALAELAALATERVHLVDRPPARSGARRGSAIAVALLAFPAGVATVSRVRFEALASAGPLVEAARQHDVDFIVGSYWTTWPAVIEARAHGLDPLGVTYRSVAIRGDINRRVADLERRGEPLLVLCADLDAAACTDELGAQTGHEFAAISVASESPLVLTVTPQP